MKCAKMFWVACSNPLYVRAFSRVAVKQLHKSWEERSADAAALAAIKLKERQLKEEKNQEILVLSTASNRTFAIADLN